MKIVTLNTWGTHEPYKKRLALTKAQISKLNPDVLCLQEVFTQEHENDLKEKSGFSHVHSSHAAGLVILSKLPLLETEELKYETVSKIDRNDRRAIFVNILLGSRTLWIATTHLAWKGADELTRMGQAIELGNKLDELGSLSIATGDFNAGPDSLSIEQLTKTGFVDLYHSLHPEKEIYTWDNDRNPYLKTHSEIFPNRRIDLILASEPLIKKSKIKSCEVVLNKPDSENDFPSDHFGVMAEIKLI